MWFSYDKDIDSTDENAKWILRDVSFVIEPGQSLAIVGATGAGKTTVAGKLAKHLSEICLLDQPFFRDATEKKQRTMEELRAETSSELGENSTIRRFTVYALGE